MWALPKMIVLIIRVQNMITIFLTDIHVLRMYADDCRPVSAEGAWQETQTVAGCHCVTVTLEALLQQLLSCIFSCSMACPTS